MDQAAIVKLSLSISFVGLFVLFVFFLFVEAEEFPISELENADADDVKIRGKVVGIKQFDAITILEVAEIKSVDVVVFDKRTLPRINETVVVAGELRDYKGSKEIVVESIKSG